MINELRKTRILFTTDAPSLGKIQSNCRDTHGFLSERVTTKFIRRLILNCSFQKILVCKLSKWILISVAPSMQSGENRQTAFPSPVIVYNTWCMENDCRSIHQSCLSLPLDLRYIRSCISNHKLIHFLGFVYRLDCSGFIYKKKHCLTRLLIRQPSV